MQLKADTQIGLSHTGTAGHNEWNWSFQTHAIILQIGKL